MTLHGEGRVGAAPAAYGPLKSEAPQSCGARTPLSSTTPETSQATPGQPDPRTPQASSGHVLHSLNKSLAHQARQASLPPDQTLEVLPSQMAPGLTSSSHHAFSPPSFGDPHDLSDDPSPLFRNEVDDVHTWFNLSELTDLNVINPFSDFPFQLSSHDDRSATKDQRFSYCTSGTEDVPDTLSAPVATYGLASVIAPNQPPLPVHPAWEPSAQTNALCTSSPLKRKAVALDDDGSDCSHSRASEIRHGGFQFFQDRKLACPFYKMNPKRYMRCGERSISNISALGQHFKTHTLKPQHCKDCFESFDEKAAEQRHKESGACVPTGGCSVDNLRGPRGKHKGTAETWYCYWEQLFPKLAPPSSPHTDGLEVVDQCMLSAIQRVIVPLRLETSTETNLILGLFSEVARWRQHPAGPLDHARLRQYDRLPASPAEPWQEGPRQSTPIRAS